MTSSPAAARQKELGAFYTPREMADGLVEWAVRSPDNRVLDASFGRLVFLEAAADRLRVLGARQPDQLLYGAELDDEAYEAAKRHPGLKGATLRDKDFFVLAPGDDLPEVEAVVGNPPYVRYQQFNGVAEVAHKLAKDAGVPLTRLASSWAPFMVHAVSFVAPGGRLAQVLPAELLHGQYAREVLDYLERSFAHTAVVVFQERVFPGALEEVVLLLAEGRGEGRRGNAQVVEYRALADMDVSALRRKLKRSARSAASEAPHRKKLLGQLLPKRTNALLDELTDRPEVVQLGQVAQVDIGAVTGANSFFLLAEDEEPSIHPRLLRPTVSKANQLPGARFSADEVEGLRQRGVKHLLFLANEDTDPQLIDAAQPYLRRGKRQGINKRYKCRIRGEHWWAVPLPGHDVPDLFLTYCSSEHPRLVLNEADALHTNTLHGVVLHSPGSGKAAALAAGFYNSLTLLSAELMGRSYGGGVLKLEPTEAEGLLIPSIPSSLGEELEAVDGLLRERQGAEATQRVDQLLLQEHLGLSARDVKVLRDGAERLRARRRARGKAPR